MLDSKLIVSSSPHIKSNETVNIIMLDVIIALLPALISASYFFGYRALLLTVITIISCVASEHLWQKMCNKPTTINDLSAVVTGLLIAFNLPVTAPLWMPVIGGFFGIIIVKQMFGGLGHNFMNPALAARAFLLASWPVAMTKWVMPFTKLPFFKAADIVSSATPLGIIQSTEVAAEIIPGYTDLFIGNISGCIGETSALMLLLGASWLLYRKIINWRIPFTFIGTVAILTFIFGKDGFFTGDALYHMLSGGLILGAFFMATDYVSSPVTPKGQIIAGIGCGVVTAVIRLYGGYPEGTTYAILLMNICVPLIDKYTIPTKFGGRLKASA